MREHDVVVQRSFGDSVSSELSFQVSYKIIESQDVLLVFAHIEDDVVTNCKDASIPGVVVLGQEAFVDHKLLLQCSIGVIEF